MPERTYKITCNECGYSEEVPESRLAYEEGKTCPRCYKGKMYWVPPTEEARRRKVGRKTMQEERRISPAVVIAGGLGLGLAAALGVAALAWAGLPPEEYVCPHCGATFATNEELLAHIQAEHPPAEYVCPHCGATFATNEELLVHIQAEHPAAYVCPYCGATIDTYEALVAHVQSAHPGERIPIDIIWE